MDTLSETFSTEICLSSIAADQNTSQALFLIPSPLSFFSSLKAKFARRSSSSTKRYLRLLQAIIPDSSPDFTSAFSGIIPYLTSFLLKEDSKISKKSFKVLTAYIKKTGDSETVILKLCQVGAKKKEITSKYKCLSYLLTFLRMNKEITEKQKIKWFILEYFQDSKELADQVLEYIQENTEHELAFGFLPIELKRKLETKPNKNTNLESIQELSERVTSIHNLNHVIKDIPSFLSFLKDILMDANFKASLLLFQIISYLIDQCQQRDTFSLLVPTCIQKLGEDKVMIRQSAFSALKLIVESIGLNSSIFPSIVQALGSDNWHIREEVLHLLKAAISTMDNFDFLSISQNIADLLNDSKAKVRHVAMETLVALCKRYKYHKVLSLIEDIPEESTLLLIQERLGTPLGNSLRFPTEPSSRSIKKSESSFSFRDHLYLDSSQIEPINNPQSAIQQCLSEEDTDWAGQFKKLNTLRRLLRHHAGLFDKPLIKKTIFTVSQYADSLRSSLSKNALIVMGDICVYLGKKCSKELSMILNVLTKKIADTNAFISEEASKILLDLPLRVNVNCLVSLLVNTDSKQSKVRSQICMCYLKMFENVKIDKIKDVDSIVRTLYKYASDSSQIVRNEAFKAIQGISHKVSDFDLLINKNLSENNGKHMKLLMRRHTEKENSKSGDRESILTNPHRLNKRESKKIHANINQLCKGLTEQTPISLSKSISLNSKKLISLI